MPKARHFSQALSANSTNGVRPIEHGLVQACRCCSATFLLRVLIGPTGKNLISRTLT